MFASGSLLRWAEAAAGSEGLGSGSRDAGGPEQVVVVDEPGIRVAVEGAAERQAAGGDGQVEGEPGVRARSVAVGEAEEVAPELEGAAARLGPARQVADCAGQRPGAVERALGPEEHLDALDVAEPQVDGERDVAEVGGDAVVVVVAGLLGARQGVGVQAAGDDDVAAARSLVHHREAGRPARELREGADRPALEVGAPQCGDAHRHRPERLHEARRRHHDGIGEEQGVERDGPEPDDRLAREGDPLQGHGPEAVERDAEPRRCRARRR